MKRITLLALFFMAFSSQFSHAQGNFVCFEAGTVTVPTPGGNNCAMVTMSPQTAGVTAQLTNNGDPITFPATGYLDGDFGQIVNDGNAVLSLGCVTQHTLTFNTVYTPGVHTVSAHFNRCDQLGPHHFDAQVMIVVLPPDPTTTPICTPTLIDPIKSNLLRGTAITTAKPLLANTTNLTTLGVAADGITQALITIKTNNVGDSVQVNLINDTGSPSNSTDQDGGLMPIGGSGGLSNSVSLVATDPGNGPLAFAIYQAPTNFARGTTNFSQDNATVNRQVSLQVFCPTSGGSINTSNLPVSILRPPLMLIHGIWADQSAWDSFAPTVSPESQVWGGLIRYASRFQLDYSQPVSVTATIPAYSPAIQSVKGSAMGFQFDAQVVLPKIRDAIGTFTAIFAVAAVQADVVGHSMGGVITRSMPLLDQPNQPPVFLTSDTYGHGPIEKLITIGTPHLGSQLALNLLPGSADVNACVRNILKDNDLVSLQTATVSGTTWPGGVGDLSGDGLDTNGASQALKNIQNVQGSQSFPMAYIAAKTNSNNLAGLDCANLFCNSNQIYVWCYSRPGTGDPLAQDLTPSSWNSVFSNADNDGIVAVTSQLNDTAATIPPFVGVIHSLGIEALDFLGPYELESGLIAIETVDLLNEAKDGPDFQH